MKHLLITGSHGTLGQALLDLCTKKGYRVTALDKDELDITDKAAVEQKVTAVAPDAVINAAAYNAVDVIEQDHDAFELGKKVNGDGPGNLAAACAGTSIPFVHVSTDYVFSGNASQPYAEDATPDPVSKYAETKLLGEQQVQEQGKDWYIVRISRLFGKAGISEQSKTSFVDLMISLVEERGKTELNVVNDEVGSPSYAPDVAAFLLFLLEEQKPSGIYHGTNSGECSWFDFAKKIFELRNLTVKLTPVPSTEFPKPAKRPPYSALANTRMPAQRSWEEALQDYLCD